jgi:Protein of unknown function (DUF1118)
VTLITALLLACGAAFTPVVKPLEKSIALKVTLNAEVDSLGNNIAVKRLLEKVEQEQLLSKVAASGLLSKAQAAGISLSKVEPLLAQVADYPELLVLVEASGPELLPILPKIVDLAPNALPLLAAAISVPTSAIAFAGFAALLAAGGAVVAIPDDSITNIATQTFIVGLALPVAGASFAGSAILGKLK